MAPHRADSPRRRIGDCIRLQVGFGRPHFCQRFLSDLLWLDLFPEWIIRPPSCVRSLPVWGVRGRWLHLFDSKQSSHSGSRTRALEHFRGGWIIETNILKRALPFTCFLFVTHPKRFITATNLTSLLHDQLQICTRSNLR